MSKGVPTINAIALSSNEEGERASKSRGKEDRNNRTTQGGDGYRCTKKNDKGPPVEIDECDDVAVAMSV